MIYFKKIIKKGRTVSDSPKFLSEMLITNLDRTQRECDQPR